MDKVYKQRLSAVAGAASLAFSSSMAAAQPVEQQPPAATPTSPAATDRQTAPAEVAPTEPETTPQSADSSPVPVVAPPPVPPVAPPGSGLHIDSTLLLGIGAAILGAGAYFIFHKKKSGTTTTNP